MFTAKNEHLCSHGDLGTHPHYYQIGTHNRLQDTCTAMGKIVMAPGDDWTQANVLISRIMTEWTSRSLE
jgi:hypothetical protein